MRRNELPVLNEDSKLRIVGKIHLKCNFRDIRDMEKKSLPISSWERFPGLSSADNKAV